jgi:hypothetical protein
VKTKQNDLAILKLKDLVNINQFVQLICLPQSNNSNQEDEWQNLTMKPTVVGWSVASSLSSEPISDVLEETVVSILNNSICNKYDDQYENKPINETADDKNITQTNDTTYSHFDFSSPRQISNQSQFICAGI